MRLVTWYTALIGWVVILAQLASTIKWLLWLTADWADQTSKDCFARVWTKVRDDIHKKNKTKNHHMRNTWMNASKCGSASIKLSETFMFSCLWNSWVFLSLGQTSSRFYLPLLINMFSASPCKKLIQNWYLHLIPLKGKRIFSKNKLSCLEMSSSWFSFCLNLISWNRPAGVIFQRKIEREKYDLAVFVQRRLQNFLTFALWFRKP